LIKKHFAQGCLAGLPGAGNRDNRVLLGKLKRFCGDFSMYHESTPGGGRMGDDFQAGSQKALDD